MPMVEPPTENPPPQASSDTFKRSKSTYSGSSPPKYSDASFWIFPRRLLTNTFSSALSKGTTGILVVWRPKPLSWGQRPLSLVPQRVSHWINLVTLKTLQTTLSQSKFINILTQNVFQPEHHHLSTGVSFSKTFFKVFSIDSQPHHWN
jgi:hypothetical protein